MSALHFTDLTKKLMEMGFQQTAIKGAIRQSKLTILFFITITIKVFFHYLW